MWASCTTKSGLVSRAFPRVSSHYVKACCTAASATVFSKIRIRQEPRFGLLPLIVPMHEPMILVFFSVESYKAVPNSKIRALLSLD